MGAMVLNLNTLYTLYLQHLLASISSNGILGVQLASQRYENEMDSSLVLVVSVRSKSDGDGNSVLDLPTLSYEHLAIAPFASFSSSAAKSPACCKYFTSSAEHATASP